MATISTVATNGASGLLFKLMKKWEKIIFYELNISFAFIFRK